MFLLFLIPILIGIGVSSQTAINAQLRSYTKSPYLASAISFFIGMLLLIALTFITKHTIAIPASVFSNNPWWIWLGSITGAFSLTVNILLFAKLGSKLAAVLPISGQIMMGIVIDQFGLFSSPITKLTLVKIIGLVFVILGLLSIVGIFESSKKVSNSSTKRVPHQFIWELLGIFSGVLFAIQTATNGRLGVVLHSPIHAALVTFTVGTIVLIIISFITKAPVLKFNNNGNKLGKKDWWVLIGGILGGINIILIAWLAPQIGTGAVVVISLFGQLGFSILVDQFAFFRSSKIPVTRLQIIGAAVMLVGIVIFYFV